VPNHLKDATLDRKASARQGYKYPHDFPGTTLRKAIWPIGDAVHPGELGYEQEMRQRLDALENQTKNQLEKLPRKARRTERDNAGPGQARLSAGW